MLRLDHTRIVLGDGAGQPAQVRAQQQWKLGSLMQPPTYGATLDDELLRPSESRPAAS